MPGTWNTARIPAYTYQSMQTHSAIAENGVLRLDRANIHRNDKTRADDLANCLFEAAKKHLPTMKLRTDWSDGSADHEVDFYILKQTLYHNLLSENCFMTNVKEVMFLESSVDQLTIIDLHIDGIDYLVNRIGGQAQYPPLRSRYSTWFQPHRDYRPAVTVTFICHAQQDCCR